MNVSIGQRWEEFVDSVVREGLRLVEEREAKLRALRQTLEASLAEGGALGQDDVGAALSAKARALSQEGF